MRVDEHSSRISSTFSGLQASSNIIVDALFGRDWTLHVRGMVMMCVCVFPGAPSVVRVFAADCGCVFFLDAPSVVQFF